MPLQATSGAASYDAFGGGVPAVPQYIEDVFSTYLYTGTGANRTITNNIDLSGKGGLVWTKSRRSLASVQNHHLYDTARGAGIFLSSNLTDAQTTLSDTLSAFNSNGFSLGSNVRSNEDEETYASWTFRKQPKFFDVVTYTGNGNNRQIAHNLGSVPGFIIIKRTDSTSDWTCYHRSLGNTTAILLNTTAASFNTFGSWDSTTPTSTEFTLGVNATVNSNGGTYVAYLFAHDAGGFGLTGTDNVISCGSYTGNGSASGPEINLGYEPQWLLIKQSSGVNDWNIWDTMRGIVTGGADLRLEPNTSDAEASIDLLSVNATGFQPTSTGSFVNANGSTYIYIAIRRGPMKVPTSGTSVFAVQNGRGATNGTATSNAWTSNFPIDWFNMGYKPGGNDTPGVTRLTQEYLYTMNTNAASAQSFYKFDDMNGVYGSSTIASNSDYVGWMFGRAPSFFDVVCYTGTGSARTVAHNLGVVPELMIVKSRTATWNWAVYHSALGNTQFTLLDSTGGPVTQSTVWNNTSPTSSVFTVGSAGYTNASGGNYVAYLFATCAGVSKVGSYTGTGTTKQIDCGFTGGARFVLIKRSEDGFSGDWYVWDSARGIVSGNDSYLLLNSTAAEVTNTDYIDTYSAGFEISSTAPAAINASGGSFIFFAVA